MIKKLYKTEKENHKYKNKYKTNKKMIKVYDRVERMKKANKNLFDFNKELMDIICEQNALIENMETEIQGNEKTMKKLSVNHDNRQKNVTKTNQSHHETKMILMIILCWILMLFMFQYSFIDDVSFMIFNFCAILSGLCMEMLY
jgi:cation transport ATPase